MDSLKNINEERWTEIITPKVKWYEINLKEIWNYRDLIRIFVRRDIVSIYKHTILGPLWFFLGPLFTVFTYTFVFSYIAKIPTDKIPAPVFYLAGTTLWNYFQACFSATSSTFLNNASIFGKVYFPRLVSPISIIISNLLKLGIQLLMFICFCLYYYFAESGVYPNLYILLLPFLVLIMGIMAMGLGITISSFTIKYRDLNYFIGVFITLLMYASPIIYPISSVPEIYKPFLALNPIAPIIETFRYSFTGYGTISWYGLGYSFLFAVSILLLGIAVFNKAEKTFIDSV